MRRRPLLWLLCGLSACASIPRLQPKPAQGDREDVIVASGPVQLRAIPNAWRGPPSNVAENFTPIWVQLVNRSEQGYDVTYASMQLIDEQGRTYAAIPPAEVLRASVGEVGDGQSGVLLAANESDTPIELAQFGFGIGMGPGYDIANPNDPYSPYNPYNRAYADGARNIVQSGLREGRLLPRTQAMGFVYFQRAYEARELRLHLESSAELPGQAPLVLEATFTVAH
jgi:hypothetical protein